MAREDEIQTLKWQQNDARHRQHDSKFDSILSRLDTVIEQGAEQISNFKVHNQRMDFLEKTIERQQQQLDKQQAELKTLNEETIPELKATAKGNKRWLAVIGSVSMAALVTILNRIKVPWW